MLPLRDFGEAEIFELCLPVGSGAGCVFLLLLLMLLFSLRKSRGHGHGHGRLGTDFGNFEAFSFQSKLFQYEIQCRFEPLQNEKRAFF
jgi:hypothetical protein